MYAAIYILARKKGPSLWDIEKQREYLYGVVDENPVGMWTLEGSFEHLVALCKQFELQPTRLITNQDNYAHVRGEAAPEELGVEVRIVGPEENVGIGASAILNVCR